jgi:hypothetical protein
MSAIDDDFCLRGTRQQGANLPVTALPVTAEHLERIVVTPGKQARNAIIDAFSGCT